MNTTQNNSIIAQIIYVVLIILGIIISYPLTIFKIANEQANTNLENARKLIPNQ